MLSRRAFLERGSLALAAMSLHTARAADAQVGPLGKPIGLQLYTVREAAAKDLPGTLRAIAAIGYREVELAGIPAMSAPDLRKVLSDCGLTAPSMHASMADLQTGLNQRIDYATTLGTRYLVCSFPWTADSRFRESPGKAVVSLPSGITLDDWKWNADFLNQKAQALKSAGIAVGYHNHNNEFAPIDGTTGMDVLLKETDPSLVTFEMDAGWVTAAGYDPFALLKEHKGRFTLMHVKDIKATTKSNFVLKQDPTEVGSGMIDWKKLLPAAYESGVRQFFVEQEPPFAHPRIESTKISHDYLASVAA